MRAPLLCRVANATGIDRLHSWKRPHKHREGGFLSTRRRCSACKVTQEREIPGGGWKTVQTQKRIRRKPESAAQAISAIRQGVAEQEDA